MAVALDVSSPVRWTGSGTTGTNLDSAAFTAPTDAFLVLTVNVDGTDDAAPTISDSGGLTWTQRVARTNTEATTGGLAAIYTARTTSSVSRTARMQVVANGSGDRHSAKLDVWTGVDVDGTPFDTVTANNEGGTNTDPTNTTSLTPGANGVLIVCETDFNQTGTITSSNLTLDQGDYAGQISVARGYRTCTSGVSVNGNLNPPATPQFKWCQIIIREAAGDTLLAQSIL